MITKEEAESLIESFFNSTGPFVEIRELVGHAASGRPDVFLKWFFAQKTEDQEVVADALIDSTLFNEERNDRLFPTALLLADVARQSPSTLSPENIQNLEQYVQRGDKVSVWLNDEDGENDGIKDARTRWRFALLLWNVLVAVGSPVAGKVFEKFIKQARDPEFVRGIRLANQVHERGPFGFQE